ncbi:MAG: tRNA lysidine(34) synthetase TilS, partial [Actinobacteria bacterium]|nr:tRNA lysidine(34) synthetase TilS [Actinomycetota bacterium]
MPSLSPAVAETRRAVRESLAALPVPPAALIVALSGGADSLALAAATAFEARAAGIRVRSLTVDHGLQDGSDRIAAEAAGKASALGIDAHVERVVVRTTGEGPEADARAARYKVLRRVAQTEGAPVLLGHTLDDQAETVLLGLSRGSGAGSLQGMAPVRTDEDGTTWIRPLLAVRREATRAACAAADLEPWDDLHNADPRYLRVRVRERVLPVLETELGPGIAEALARTAEQLREDAEAFDEMIHETIEDIVEHAEAGISVSAAALAANPAARRNRVMRLGVQSELGVGLTRVQTVEVARLVTDWSGQGPA